MLVKALVGKRVCFHILLGLWCLRVSTQIITSNYYVVQRSFYPAQDFLLVFLFGKSISISRKLDFYFPTKSKKFIMSSEQSCMKTMVYAFGISGE